MGASVAYHLAHEDPSLKIAIVERDVAGAHASAPRSAGGIRQQFSLRTNIELSLYGIDASAAELREQFGVAVRQAPASLLLIGLGLGYRRAISPDAPAI